MRVPKKKVRIRINILELQTGVDQKALVRSCNRAPSTPPHFEHVRSHRFSLKFVALQDNRLQHFETVFLWDSDMFLCATSEAKLTMAHLLKEDGDKSKFGVNFTHGGLQSIEGRAWWKHQYQIEIEEEA